VDRLGQVAVCHDTTPGAVAVAGPSATLPRNGATAGFRAPARVDPVLAAANLEPEDHLATIEGKD